MYLQARYPAIATTQNWYIALAHSVRDRMLERWVDTVKAYAARDVQGRVLLLGRVPDRPAARQQPDVPRHRGRRARRYRRARPGPRRVARARGRAGPRQRRPRPARRVLSRLARRARATRDGLRDSLRVRHLRPGDPRRLAGGDHRQVAALRQPLGNRAPRGRLVCELRRPHRALHRQRRSSSRSLGTGEPRQGHRVRHSGPGLSRQHLQHVAALAQRGRRVVRLRATSTSATTTARSARR